MKNKFSVVEEKHLGALPEAVSLVSWNPCFDLIAIVSKNQQQVSVHRPVQYQKLPYTLQHSNESQSTKNDPKPNHLIQVNCLCWRPDGRALALGYNNGVLRIHDVENGDCMQEELFPHPIKSLNWTVSEEEQHKKYKQTFNSDVFDDYSSDRHSGEQLDLQKYILSSIFDISNYVFPITKTPEPTSLSNRLLSIISEPNGNNSFSTQQTSLSQDKFDLCTVENLEENEIAKESQQQNEGLLTVLAVATTHTIHLRAYGTFPLSDQCLDSLTVGKKQEIEHVQVSSNLKRLIVIYQDASNGTRNLITMDTTLALHSKRYSISDISNHWYYLHSIIEFQMNSIFEYVRKTWDQYFTKYLVPIFSELKSMFDEEGMTDQQFNLVNIFSMLLSTGMVSHPLMRWLSTYLTERKFNQILQQLELTNRIISIYVRDYLQHRFIEHILLRLTKMNTDTLFDSNDKYHGDQSKFVQLKIKNLIESIISVEQHAHHYLTILNENYVQIKTFILWIRVMSDEFNETSAESRLQHQKELELASPLTKGNTYPFSMLGFLQNATYSSSPLDVCTFNLDDKLGSYWNESAAIFKNVLQQFRESFKCITERTTSQFSLISHFSMTPVQDFSILQVSQMEKFLFIGCVLNMDKIALLCYDTEKHMDKTAFRMALYDCSFLGNEEIEAQSGNFLSANFTVPSTPPLSFNFYKQINEEDTSLTDMKLLIFSEPRHTLLLYDMDINNDFQDFDYHNNSIENAVMNEDGITNIPLCDVELQRLYEHTHVISLNSSSKSGLCSLTTKNKMITLLNLQEHEEDEEFEEEIDE